MSFTVNLKHLGVISTVTVVFVSFSPAFACAKVLFVLPSVYRTVYNYAFLSRTKYFCSDELADCSFAKLQAFANLKKWSK